MGANLHCLIYTVWKVSKYRVFSGPYFPIFVNLCIQCKYRKIRIRKNSTRLRSKHKLFCTNSFVLVHLSAKNFTRKNSVFGRFSSSAIMCYLTSFSYILPSVTVKNIRRGHAQHKVFNCFNWTLTGELKIDKIRKLG